MLIELKALGGSQKLMETQQKIRNPSQHRQAAVAETAVKLG